MREFARLCEQLASAVRTSGKVRAMAEYFAQAAPSDAAWATYLLTGHRPKRTIAPSALRTWATEVAALPEWLMMECETTMGDLAETVSAVIPLSGEPADDTPLHEWMESTFPALVGLGEAAVQERIHSIWKDLSRGERAVVNRLLIGTFRPGVSQEAVARALAEVTGVSAAAIFQRLAEDLAPTPGFFLSLVGPETRRLDAGRPHPFCVASPLIGRPDDLGEAETWVAEWCWDGIRAQLIRRSGISAIWGLSELLTHALPELRAVCDALPDGVVIDGEVVAHRNGQPLEIEALRRRIGRKTQTDQLLQEVPAVLFAFDLLEWEGEDWRGRPLAERRAQLEAAVAALGVPHVAVLPALPGQWASRSAALQRSRPVGAKSLLLRSLIEVHGAPWWTWKPDSLSIDAVLMYAQRGNGMAASPHILYTFGVWQDDELISIAKAPLGLPDEEIAEVDDFIRCHTIEKVGPIRTVKPALVMEIAFDEVQLSSRHKAGVVLRATRVVRWRRESSAYEAGTLAQVREFVDS